MKKMFLIVPILVIMQSCDETKPKKAVDVSKNDEFETVLFDSCEYLIWKEYEPFTTSYLSGITHKGNCKNHKR